MPDHLIFTGNDFEAFDRAVMFLRRAGFSCGSMQAHSPSGVLYGDFSISKWRNMDTKAREMLDGTITAVDDSFRRGPVTIEIRDSAPQEARSAFARAKAKYQAKHKAKTATTSPRTSRNDSDAQS